MTYQFIKVETKEHVTLITINRPEVMNALHQQASAEMSQAFDAFAANDDAWVAIVTGAGERAFSAGFDLKAAASGETFDPSWKGGFGGITHRDDLFKPVIAAVNGVAYGGGFEIALACDIVVAAESARFALPEPRVGLIAGGGGIHRLPRYIPFKIAMGMMLRGKPIDAEEAYRLGLINELVPDDALLEVARSWAREIMECAPLAVRLTKQAALQNYHLSLSEAMRAEPPLTPLWRDSNDTREGPLAFAEKRKPTWLGR